MSQLGVSDFISDIGDFAQAIGALNLPANFIFVGYPGRFTLPNGPSLLKKQKKNYKFHFCHTTI
jgi:hypothetical protein